MALGIGIAGLPNVGKSTLFNALTQAQNAQAANYPFCTIEPNKATVAVPDTRVVNLTHKVNPKKTVFANVDFIDIAGLVRGASKGEGLGNQFLANIRDCAAIVHVVRCYEDDNITHVEGKIAPLEDIEIINTEFILADIQTVEKRLEKLRRQTKGNKDLKNPLNNLEKLLMHLNEVFPASTFKMPDDDFFISIWKEMGLISAKPVIYCANVDEKGVVGGNKFSEEVKEYAQTHNASFSLICAKLEEELQGLAQTEKEELLSLYNISEDGLSSIIRAGYSTLGLCSYFTAGPDEVRAWTIKKGWKAPKAAGVIHSDFEKGFIRAEVISYEDYMNHKSESECRAAGVLRTEGKDYEVRDGDVIHFLFNV